MKVILVHGGKYFTSGNNIKALASVLGDKEAITEYSNHISYNCIGPYLYALFDSVKPIVGVVRGGAIGFGFTVLSLFDFVYASPDAFFMTPFMQTM